VNHFVFVRKSTLSGAEVKLTQVAKNHFALQQQLYGISHLKLLFPDIVLETIFSCLFTRRKI
jgi:hypothetical protein